MAKATNPYRGKLVHIRKTWGRDAGQVDEEHVYQVKQCGPIVATLTQVDKQTLVPYRRGQKYYLSSQIEMARWRAQLAQSTQRGYHEFRFSDWSQFFVTLGEVGWDPSQNF